MIDVRKFIWNKWRTLAKNKNKKYLTVKNSTDSDPFQVERSYRFVEQCSKRRSATAPETNKVNLCAKYDKNNDVSILFWGIFAFGALSLKPISLCRSEQNKV